MLKSMSAAGAGAGEIIREVVGSVTKQHHDDTTNMAGQQPPNVPNELRSMIQLNIAYGVLICPHDRCRKAVQPSAFTRHSHEEHGTTIRARRELEAFIKKLAWEYDSRTIERPDDGSKPQPTIPVSDGVECRFCIAESRDPTFKTRKQTSMRKIMKTHGNKVHNRYEVPDEKLYKEVRVQTWFRGNGEARYWRVEEHDDVAEETPVVHSEGGMADVIDGDDTGAINDAPIAIASEHESADMREGVRASLIVIESDDEVFVRRGKGRIRPAKDDSRDESVGVPEKDPRATTVIIDSDDELLAPRRRRPIRAVESVSIPDEEVTAAAIVISSDDEVLVPRNRGRISIVEVDSSDGSDGDADYSPSSEEVSSDEEGGSSTVETETGDAENMEARQPTAGQRTVVMTPRPRKRKVQPASAIAINPDDDPYQPFSPPFDQPSPKRQWRMSPFVDSGVVMPPSSEHRVRVAGRADDGIVPHSSAPIESWTIESQPDVEDGVPDARRAGHEAAHDTCQDPESAFPSPVPFVFGRRQPTLEALRRHLDTWCQACPSCMSETDVERVMHHIEDCWRADTVDIIKSTRTAQQHIDERGGFGGRDGCERCGMPRTICQRWQARPGGGGWEEVAEEVCQYEKRLTAAVITMLMDGCPEGWAVAKEWMTRAGVRPTKKAEVFEWFREAAWWADTAMEVCRMARVFHMLAEKNRKVIRW
jgi:hypothetical protein